MEQDKEQQELMGGGENAPQRTALHDIRAGGAGARRAPLQSDGMHSGVRPAQPSAARTAQQENPSMLEIQEDTDPLVSSGTVPPHPPPRPVLWAHRQYSSFPSTNPCPAARRHRHRRPITGSPSQPAA
jgi:hypothetical protein